MKLSEMSPCSNPVHKAFADAAAAFQQDAPWRKLLDAHIRVEFEGQGEFRYFKYVKDKMQLFREYGDVLQSERSKDVATYAAPEGQLELEIRPERLEKDKPKEPRPRVNVYVPQLTPLKEGDQGYSHRIATEDEIQQLTFFLRAGAALHAEAASLPTREPVAKHEKIAAESAHPVTLYEPFTRVVAVDGVDVTLTNSCALSKTVKRCAHCSRMREDMPRCAGCKVTYYCSAAHQKLDWKLGHKKLCAVRAKEAAEAEAAAAAAHVDPEGLPAFAPGDREVRCYAPALPLEAFHAQNEATIPAEHLLKDAAAWERGEAPTLPAEPPAAPVASWRGAYDALALPFPDSPEHAVPLTQPMTVYHILTSLLKDHPAVTGKDVVTVHLVDACLEVPTVETFGILAALLPAGFPRLRFVLIGRRMDKALHYRVASWADRRTLQHVEAPPTGVMGDVWRGCDDHATAVRFFCDDYTTFGRKSEGDQGHADVIVNLNCIGARHSFFHNTTHICVQKLATTPVFLCCYTKFEAQNIVGAFEEVAAKEKAPFGAARPALPNPFKSPLRCAADSPLPCYANAFITAWY